MFPNDDSNDTMNVPEQIQDRFKVISKISSGGVGVVYEARDRILEKRVAIKMLHSISGQSEELIRFQREAKAASQLDHANIVKVFDFGMTDGAQPYMVMEYVDGVPLSRFLDKNGPLSYELCCVIFEQILDGLAHAHSHGVIHRDLKPANVMLRNVTATIPHVVLVDFGLAKIQSRDKGNLTRTGVVAGSPLYMSPEQAEALPAGKESDIYSIGCMLFCALTGEPPFHGDTAIDTLMMHVKQDAPKLASVNGKPHLEKIEQVVAKCLSKKPADRYQSAEQLKTALHDALGEEPQSADQSQSIEKSNDKSGDVAGSRVVTGSLSPGILMVASVIAVLATGLFVALSQIAPPEKALRTSLTTDNGIPGSAANDPRLNAGRRQLKDNAVGLSLKKVVPDLYTLDRISSEDGGKTWRLRYTSNADELLREAPKPICTQLDASGSSLSDDGLKTIENWQLRELDVSDTKITDAGFKSIAKIKTLRQLRMNKLNGQLSSAALRELHQLPELHSIKMQNCTFNDDIMQAIPGFKNVDHWHLSDSEWMKPQDLKQFAKMKQIQFLDLQYNSKLDFPDVEQLQKALPGCKIRFTERVRYLPGVRNDRARRIMIDEPKEPSENKGERIQ